MSGLKLFRAIRRMVFTLLIVTICTAGTRSVLAFEKSIANATGYLGYNGYLKKSASTSAANVVSLPAGKPFRIISESGNWWKVEYSGKTGYVQHAYCMINLPDVEPGIVYQITNASSSIYKSSGYSLENVTGKKLYSAGKVQNDRLGRKEYIVPVLYSTAKMISKANDYAKKDGYLLKIYDAYRPSGITGKIRDSLAVLYKSKTAVKKGIDYSYGASGTQYTWGQGWFLAQNVSAHNLGAAIDVTLVNKSTKKELAMPTEMHELSTAAIKYYSASCSKTAANYAKSMTAAAKKLDSYCTKAGMTTLASEWWHFQDNTGYNTLKSKLGGSGCSFQVTSVCSK